jgi:hypothetical protein
VRIGFDAFTLDLDTRGLRVRIGFHERHIGGCMHPTPSGIAPLTGGSRPLPKFTQIYGGAECH